MNLVFLCLLVLNQFCLKLFLLKRRMLGCLRLFFLGKKKKRNAAMLDKKVSIEFVINLSLKRLNFSKPCDVDKPVVDENVQSTAV